MPRSAKAERKRQMVVWPLADLTVPVRRAIVQAEAAEATERQPVGQRFLETRIGELVPLRQQQRAEHRQRRIAGPAGGRA
jgi:hypothetical protein